MRVVCKYTVIEHTSKFILTFRNSSSKRKILFENDASENGFHFRNAGADGVGRDDVDVARAKQDEDDGEENPSHVLKDLAETGGGEGRKTFY